MLIRKVDEYQALVSGAFFDNPDAATKTLSEFMDGRGLTTFVHFSASLTPPVTVYS
jgi:hypothetical protein